MNFKHCEIHHFLLLNFMHNCIIFGSYFKHLKRKQIARFMHNWYFYGLSKENCICTFNVSSFYDTYYSLSGW